MIQGKKEFTAHTRTDTNTNRTELATMLSTSGASPRVEFGRLVGRSVGSTLAGLPDLHDKIHFLLGPFRHLFKRQTMPHWSVHRPIALSARREFRFHA